MKFASALLASSLLLSGGPIPHAAGPDDTYLEAYRLIQEADQLAETARPGVARQRYQQAIENLKRLQAGYPDYSKNAVEFRLEYIQDKLGALPAADQPAPARPAATPAANPLEELTGRAARLEADNALLQAKLQEALAARPAAADPGEFAQAQEKIKQLEKEKELLRAGLDQAQAKQPNAGDALALQQSHSELESTRKKLVDNIASLAALTRENQELRQQLASPKPAAEPADNPRGDQARIKDLEKERDALLKKLNDTNKEVYDLKARGQAAQFSTLTNQISNLRARLEIFEARKVPYTKEELALLDKSAPPKLSAEIDPKIGKKAPRELPPGAGILVAEAERAFAARRYPEAEQKYSEVLKLDADNPISLANLAAIQLEMQKLPEAEANLQKALAAAPDDPYALTLTGMLRFQQGKYDEALAVLSKSAQLDPKNPETQNYLGITLSQLGQRETAETALRKAIQLNPNYAIAHHNLAVVYATQRPPFIELAKYHYNRALQLGHPGTPELEKQIGR